jgi:hypothetical protein
MSERFTIRPAVEGARLIDPDSGDILPAEGAEVLRSAYWLMCLARGDVIEIAVTPSADTAPTETTSAGKRRS